MKCIAHIQERRNGDNSLNEFTMMWFFSNVVIMIRRDQCNYNKTTIKQLQLKKNIKSYLRLSSGKGDLAAVGDVINGL